MSTQQIREVDINKNHEVQEKKMTSLTLGIELGSKRRR